MSVFNRRKLLVQCLALVLCVCIPGSLIGQDLSFTWPEGLDTELFVTYMDRADAAFNQLEWRRIASRGVEIVVNRWEEEYILADGLGRWESGDEIRGVLERIADQRFLRFVLLDFFRNEQEPEVDILRESIRQANIDFLFKVDPETGRILKDSLGMPLLKTIEGADDDRAHYRSRLSLTIDGMLDSYTSTAQARFGEILSFLPKDQVDTALHLFNASFSRYRGGYRQELEILAVVEERRFYARRTRDQFSLKYRSEESSADTIARTIIEEAQEELRQGLAAVEERLAVPDVPDTATGPIDVDTWRSDFTRIFERGMDQWDRAEQQFFQERMLWERNSYQAFQEGETLWREGYGLLMAARTHWEEELVRLFEEGSESWGKKESELVLAIQSAEEDMEAAINAREHSMRLRVEQIINLYSEASTTVSKARESLEYWRQPGNTTAAFIDDQGITRTYVGFWEEIERANLDRMADAEKTLISLYSAVLTGDAGLPLRFSDFDGGYGLDEQLNDFDLQHWNGLSLDSWQVELLKAEVSRDYWDNQYDIARAVYEYASDLSSLRPREEETRKRYEEAFSIWEAAETSYQAVRVRLGEAAAELEAARENLDLAKRNMDEAAAGLAEAEAVYDEAALLVEAGSDTSFFLTRLSRYYQDLLEQSGCATGTSILEEQGEAYFHEANKYLMNSRYNRAISLFRDLYIGNEGVASYETLKYRFSAAAAWTFSAEGSWEDDCMAMGIGSSHYLYPLLQGAWDSYRSALTLAGPENEIEAVLYVEECRIHSLMSRVREIAEQDAVRRRLELQLLTAPSSDAWFERLGYDMVEDEETFIQEHERVREGRHLWNRLETELGLTEKAERILNDLLARRIEVGDLWGEESDRSPEVAYVLEEVVLNKKDVPGILEEMREWEGMLLGLSDFFLSEPDLSRRFDLQSRLEELQYLVDSSDSAEQFAQGSSMFNLFEISGSSSHIQDILASEVLNQYRSAAPFRFVEDRGEILERTVRVLDTYLPERDGNFWEAWNGSLIDLIEMAFEFETLGRKLPEYAEAELTACRNLLLSYGVALAETKEMRLDPIDDETGEQLVKNYLLQKAEDPSGELDWQWWESEIFRIRDMLGQRIGENRWNWRAYIGREYQDTDILPSQLYPESWNNLQDHPLSEADQGIFTTITSPPGEPAQWLPNEILDIYLKTAYVGRMLLEAVNIYTDPKDRHKRFEDYSSRFGDFFFDENSMPSSISDRMVNEGEADAARAYSRYVQQRYVRDQLEEKIAETGHLIYRLEHSNGAEALKRRLQDAGKELQRAGETYNDRIADYETGIVNYQQQEGDYSRIFREAEEAEHFYREAAHILDREEAVMVFAASAYTDTGAIPLDRLSRVFMKKQLADAAYEALIAVGTEDRKDFALLDEGYRQYYEEYVAAGKDNMWLTMLSSLLGEEIGRQTRIVEAARETADHHLSGIVDPAYQYQIEKSDLGRGIDSLGNPTTIFLSKTARNDFFYYGGTRSMLVEEEGFTIPRAEFEQQAFLTDTEGRLFETDRSRWAVDLFSFIQQEGLKDTKLFTFFQRFALAVLHKDKLSGEEVSVASLLIEPVVFEEKLGTSEYTQLEEAFGSLLEQSYIEIIGNDSAGELFDFYYMMRNRDLVQQLVTPRGTDSDVKALARDWVLSQTITSLDTAIQEAEDIYTGCMISYASALALAAAFSWVPGLGQFFLILAGYSLWLAGIHAGIITEKENFKEYLDLTEKGTNTPEYTADLAAFREKLKIHAENVDVLTREENILFTMQGHINTESFIGAGQLADAVSEALEIRGMDLSTYLNLKDVDLAGRTNGQFLTDLIERYEDQTGEAERGGAVETLIEMGQIAKRNGKKTMDRLQEEYMRLSFLQKNRETAYYQSLINLERFLLSAAYDPALDLFIPQQGTHPEKVAELLESVNTAAQAAFLETAAVDRTHQGRLIETGFSLSGYGEGRTGGSEVVTEQLHNLATHITGLYSSSLASIRGMKEREWSLMRENLYERYASWTEVLEFAQDQGTAEWEKAAARFQAECRRWLTDFETRMRERQGWWDIRYAGFMEAKSRWVQGVARESSGDPTSLIDPLRDSMSDLMGEPNLPVEEVTNAVLKTTSRIFSSTLESVRIAANTASRIDSGLQGHIRPDVFSLIEAETLVGGKQQEERNEIKQQILHITALKALDSIVEADEELDTQIEQANENVEKSIDGILRAAGYEKNSSGSAARYNRTTLMDSTLFGGNEYQTMSLDGYIFFSRPTTTFIDPGFKMDIGSFRGKPAEVMELMIQRGFSAVKKIYDVIFGDGKEYQEKIAGHRKELVQEQKSYSWRGREGTEHTRSWIEERLEYIKELYTVSVRSGLFFEHVGVAPEMMADDEVDPLLAADPTEMGKNLKHKGQGELGRILVEYMRQTLLQSRGILEYRKPVYDRRLWDDDGSKFFKAPTLRSLADLAVGGAALFAGGGIVSAALLNLADNALFAAADLANGGNQSEIMLTFGKQIVSSAFTAGLGAASALLGKGLQSFGGKTILSLGTTAVRNAATGAVGAVGIGEKGRLTWDEDYFLDSIAGRDALAGYAGIVIGGTAGSGLMEGIRGTIGNDYYHALDLAGIVETGMRAGIDYGITGDTVLSLSSIRSGGGRAGIVELHLGDDGVFGNFGGAGYDLGVTTILSASRGLNVFGRNKAILGAGFTGDTAAALRLLSSLEKAETTALYEQLLERKTRLIFDPRLAGTAQTHRTEGGAIIRVNPGSGNLNGLGLGTILAHEAFRDGYGGMNNRGETLLAVLAHTLSAEEAVKIYGDHFLDKTMINDMNALALLRETGDEDRYAEYVEQTYDSSGDFWKVNFGKDGTLTMADDGLDDVAIVNEARGDEYRYSYTGGSKTKFISDSLTDYFGYEAVSRSQVIEGMMAAGWSYKTELGGAEKAAYYASPTGFFNSSGSTRVVSLGSISPRQNDMVKTNRKFSDTVVHQLGNVWSRSKQWGQGLLQGITSLFKSDDSADGYYGRGVISWREFGALTETQDVHTRSTMYEQENWYTRGHPARDIIGSGSVKFAESLYLIRTGRNNRRLLYELAENGDYLYFAHVDEEDVLALRNILEREAGDRVLFEAGSALFPFPTTKDTNATAPVLHVELYRRREDGTYWFGDPYTGEFLEEFRFEWSSDGDDFNEWKIKLPLYSKYWY